MVGVSGGVQMVGKVSRLNGGGRVVVVMRWGFLRKFWRGIFTIRRIFT